MSCALHRVSKNHSGTLHMIITQPYITDCMVKRGQAELLAASKSDDVTLNKAASRLKMSHIYRWLEIPRAQADFPDTFISKFYFNSLI